MLLASVLEGLISKYWIMELNESSAGRLEESLVARWPGNSHNGEEIHHKTKSNEDKPNT